MTHNDNACDLMAENGNLIAANEALVKALTDLCDEIAADENHGDGAFEEECSVCQSHQRARDLLAALANAGAKK